MKTNLTWRMVVIVVTILICVFGIIGIPKSGESAKPVLYVLLFVFYVLAAFVSIFFKSPRPSQSTR
jgi:Na+-transporting methylmalonyl-CoA/oxaloacetate decarboxylase gamma subunit